MMATYACLMGQCNIVLIIVSFVRAKASAMCVVMVITFKVVIVSPMQPCPPSHHVKWHFISPCVNSVLKGIIQALTINVMVSPTSPVMWLIVSLAIHKYQIIVQHVWMGISLTHPVNVSPTPATSPIACNVRIRLVLNAMISIYQRIINAMFNHLDAKSKIVRCVSLLTFVYSVCLVMKCTIILMVQALNV